MIIEATGSLGSLGVGEPTEVVSGKFITQVMKYAVGLICRCLNSLLKDTPFLIILLVNWWSYE